MQLTSPHFAEGTRIPERFTCEGENVSPELSITGVPEGARCLVLIMDDPDAPMGTFLHWTVWNLPYTLDKIPSGTLPIGATEGENGRGETGYIGPCPPTGTHRYFFRLYALNKTLDLPYGSSRESLDEAMVGHVIAQTELVGLYSKRTNSSEALHGE